MGDARVRGLRRRLRAEGDVEHARFHKGYHKSELSFHGLKTPALRAAVRAEFPTRPKLTREDVRALAEELWSRPWFEERIAALELLARLPDQLTLGDLAFLKRLTTECDGWALLDHLACNTLSYMALARGVPLYDKVRGWTTHRCLWTRRASILVHLRPARAGELCHEHAWSTFEERLFEEDFFIRKAIGWALRECSKQYPEEVCRFLARVGDKASPLTRREGARHLPGPLRERLIEG